MRSHKVGRKMIQYAIQSSADAAVKVQIYVFVF